MIRALAPFLAAALAAGLATASPAAEQDSPADLPASGGALATLRSNLAGFREAMSSHKPQELAELAAINAEIAKHVTPSSVAPAGEADPLAVASRRVTGSGMLTGSVVVPCVSDPVGLDPMYSNSSNPGSVFLEGTVSVTGPAGAHGEIRFSGVVTVLQTCQNGNASVSGSGKVQGTGTIYDAQGKPVGSVNLTKDVGIAEFGSAEIHVSLPVDVDSEF